MKNAFIYLIIIGCVAFFGLILGNITIKALWAVGIDLRPYINNAPYEIQALERRQKAEQEWYKKPYKERRKIEKEIDIMLNDMRRECIIKCLRELNDDKDFCKMWCSEHGY